MSVAGSASVHEAAGRRGALPSRIKPVSPSMRVLGPAFPVRCPPGDNLWLHWALAAAPAGAVLVVAVPGDAEYGYWGEIMCHAAMARGIAGLVIDGGIRDSAVLAELGFPVFSNGICIRGTGKDPDSDGALNSAVTLGEITIEPGDLVVGDEDGVVVLPAADAEYILARARQRDEDEIKIISELANGRTTVDIYALPPHLRSVL
ncbi:4-carboxy-4-hydroxy-2-oxoadipate aldolase/oxaloacetate decarboxylase [Nocardia sp. NPDC004123]